MKSNITLQSIPTSIRTTRAAFVQIIRSRLINKPSETIKRFRGLAATVAGSSLLLLCGCASARRAQGTALAEESYHVNVPGVLQGIMAEQLEHKDGEAQNILVLSGGAAHGAFGAGALNGWHSNGNVPQWDVVTGISTGALLATCAFLGGEEDYGILHTNYTQIKTSDIIKPKWCGIKFLAAIFANSLSSSAPLKRRISQEITNEKIRQVADPRNAHRKLFVGTVDLYSGKFYIWDMTKLAGEAARTGSTALFDMYREILLASAAIPGFFPPVKIGASASPHVDGGTREQLFFRDQFLKAVTETKGRYKRAKDARIQGSVQPLAGGSSETERRLFSLPQEKLTRIGSSATHLYVIVNGPLTIDAAVTGSSAISIGFRSISILTDAALVSDLFATEAMAAQHHISFSYLAEGADAPPITSGEFKGDEMTKLYDYGYKQGKTGQWKSNVQFDDVNSLK